MSHLHEQLDDLVEAPSRQVRVDPAAAWAGGVRRRRRRTALAGAGATLAVVLVVLVATSGWLTPDRIQPAGRDGRPGVTGYPDRVEAPWWVRDLPARPGPLAGLVELESGEWRGVSASGRQWRLPDQQDRTPALSPDGTHLAGFGAGDPEDARFEVRDLVRGEVVGMDQVGIGASSARADGPSTSLYVSPQQPVVWSPDGTRVAARGGPTGAGRDGAVLMGFGGTATVTPRPGRATYFVGWVGDDRLAWLGTSKDPVYVEIDLDGEVLRRVELPSLPDEMSQWSGSLSPDERFLAIAWPRSTSALVYDLTTGQQSGYTPLSPTSTTSEVGCPTTWVDDEPIVPTYADVLAGRVRTDPRLGEITCSIWATDAIAAGPQRSLTDRLPWRWREIGAGVLAGLLLLAGSVTWRIRRGVRRRAATG
ncbi:hypothetical protein [Nocardioides flavescens]|uniref:Uncharacterized protein n=1 Tax=Nocardioides flavescens TaxID=2691959 RepID=A0A6L7F006_9ACTN|nr:hypothetical protein [Nocardioides flavescens]MXG90039.1 hypothetical protein [Nocardioides flavescens]